MGLEAVLPGPQNALYIMLSLLCYVMKHLGNDSGTGSVTIFC